MSISKSHDREWKGFVPGNKMYLEQWSASQIILRQKDMWSILDYMMDRNFFSVILVFFNLLLL